MARVEIAVEPAPKLMGSSVREPVGSTVGTSRRPDAVTSVNPTFLGRLLALGFGMAICTGAAIGRADAKPSTNSPSGEPPAGAVALSAAPPQTVELTLPFTGIWGVVQGFDSGETHVGYAAYALDFVPAERLDRATPEAQRRRLTDFPCFGRPVLAPADGKVVWARDGAPDLPPFNKAKHDPGNFVILEHAQDEYTELRHLQSGSVRVKVGDRVSRGEEIARCGNSGNAKTPHLHLGFLGSVNPIATRPMRFSRYEVLQADGSWRPGDGVPRAREILRPAATTGQAPSPREKTEGGRLRREVRAR